MPLSGIPLNDFRHSGRGEIFTSTILKQLFQSRFSSRQLIVVSNRQPYAHIRLPDGGIEVQTAPGGLVAALEPVLRACSGVWVAHGSGSADRECVDMSDRMAVPIEMPCYTLRRIWLSSEEEDGYYYRFSNGGLWPLCHSTEVDPLFTRSDFDAYETVNRRFAAAVLQEAAAIDPVILVQDYQLALLPGLIRERLPNAIIAIFWHIPWPRAERYRLCPWGRDIVVSMLEADTVGFNTAEHCRNFFSTIDDAGVGRPDQQNGVVHQLDHACRVANYAESIEWSPKWLADIPSAEQCRVQVRNRYCIGANVLVGLGVDRWDYTKGIVERLLALDMLFDSNPQYRGRIAFLQIAAPSRSKLAAYRALQSSTITLVESINGKYQTAGWVPIILVSEAKLRQTVYWLYRSADFCLVNSLHDGMNLVAKEFVAARADEDGVLILSTSTGAAVELKEALLIDPQDISATAAAIESAVLMSQKERQHRMRSMRKTVEANNVYTWAGHILADLANAFSGSGNK